MTNEKFKYVQYAIFAQLLPYQIARFLWHSLTLYLHENPRCHSCPCWLKLFSWSVLMLPPRQQLAHGMAWSAHNGRNHKEKACCDAFVCKQRKGPHYTNLFSLVHLQDTISGLQSFYNSNRAEITWGKRSQLLLLLFFISPSMLEQGH